MGQRYQKKKKKKKWLWIMLLTPVLLLLLVAGYAVSQYYSGLKQTEKSGDVAKTEKVTFNGQKDIEGKVNILLVGDDHRKGEKRSNSDSMMIVQYDPDTKAAKVVSLMRDMYVSIPGYNDSKLNAAYRIGGPELLRKTIKENFGVDVQYYVAIDFKGFERVIDTLAPDGIKINVEKAMSKNIGVSLEPGWQNLNGKQLLGYARFRHDAESDFGRVRRQQQVIKAVTNKIVSANGIMKAPKLLGTIQPYVRTNIDKLDGLALMKDLLFFDTKNIETLTLPVKGSWTNGRINRDQIGLILRIDKKANSEAVQSFLNGDQNSEVAHSKESSSSNDVPH
ncbi:LCP family protein [Camelliibacillus cellulosilyticus]|uniref:Regulatory protein MsrR n=1 Tax=Camelliibacillus cellulosilyticus TaxID=2174486 RepID=A0ABV9GMN7_9BACL